MQSIALRDSATSRGTLLSAIGSRRCAPCGMRPPACWCCRPGVSLRKALRPVPPPKNMAASRTVSFSTNLSTSAQASPSPMCESASTMKYLSSPRSAAWRVARARIS